MQHLSDQELRQYFPKAADLTRFTATDLADAAIELNGRPRKTALLQP